MGYIAVRMSVISLSVPRYSCHSACMGIIVISSWKSCFRSPFCIFSLSENCKYYTILQPVHNDSKSPNQRDPLSSSWLFFGIQKTGGGVNFYPRGHHLKVNHRNENSHAKIANKNMHVMATKLYVHSIFQRSDAFDRVTVSDSTVNVRAACAANKLLSIHIEPYQLRCSESRHETRSTNVQLPN